MTTSITASPMQQSAVRAVRGNVPYVGRRCRYSLERIPSSSKVQPYFGKDKVYSIET